MHVPACSAPGKRPGGTSASATCTLIAPCHHSPANEASHAWTSSMEGKSCTIEPNAGLRTDDVDLSMVASRNYSELSAGREALREPPLRRWHREEISRLPLRSSRQ
jgi:hypothetical protein